MKRRKFLIVSTIPLLSIPGCLDRSSGNDEICIDEPQGGDVEFISSEFLITNTKCINDDMGFDTSARNTAQISFDQKTVRISGTITDGEPGRTVELRQCDMDWAEQQLNIDVYTADSDQSQDCVTENEYKIIVEYYDPQDRADSARVSHNGQVIAEK